MCATAVAPDGSDDNKENSNGEEKVLNDPNLNDKAKGDKEMVEEGVELMHLTKEVIFKHSPVVQQPHMKLEGVLLSAVIKLQTAAAYIEVLRALGVSSIFNLLFLDILM